MKANGIRWKLTGACAFAFLISLGLGTAFAAAAEDAPADPVLTMTEGASVRNTDPMGIRFTTHISQQDYAEIMEADQTATFGTLVIPDRLLGGGITEENFDEVRSDAADIVVKEWRPDINGMKEYTGVLVGRDNGDGTFENFSAEFYNEQLTAISYCEYTDGGTEKLILADNPQTRSIAYVASAALANGETNGKDYLTEIVDTIVDSISLDEKQIILANGEMRQLVVTGNEGLVVSYTSSDPEIAEVDAEGEITAVSEGIATITASIGSASASCSVEVSARSVIEVESFTDATTVDAVTRVVGGSDAYQENQWFDTLGGEQGVVRVQYAGEWPVFRIKPRGTESDYERFKNGYLAVKVYLPGGVVDPDFDDTADPNTTAKITKINIGNRAVPDSEVGPIAGCTIAYDQWITLYYDADKFWSGGFGEAELLPGAVVTDPSKGIYGYVYFGEVYFTTTLDIVLPGEVEHFGHADSEERIEIVNIGNDDGTEMFTIGNVTAEILPEYNGAKGVLKITWENTDGFGIKCTTRTDRAENEADYQNFAVRVYIDGTSTVTQEYEVNTIGLKGLRPFSVGNMSWSGTVIKDRWIEALWNEPGFSGREKFYQVDETFYFSFGTVGSGTLYIDNVWFY